MITTQISFIDCTTAETWTITNEWHTLHDVTEYLLERPPENVVTKDTYLVDVKVSEGVNLYFKGFQGAWELINQSDYQHTWQYEYKRALETKTLMDNLRKQGAVKPITHDDPEKQAALERIRQKALEEPQRRKDRYAVR